MNLDQWRDMVSDAVCYWEPRRVLYNVLLTAVVLLHFAAHWPASLRSIGFNSVLGLFLLAVLANVAYCAAYPADLFLQLSSYREQRRWWRGVIAVVGFTFAAILTHFFALGGFSPVD